VRIKKRWLLVVLLIALLTETCLGACDKRESAQHKFQRECVAKGFTWQHQPAHLNVDTCTDQRNGKTTSIFNDGAAP